MFTKNKWCYKCDGSVQKTYEVIRDYTLKARRCMFKKIMIDIDKLLRIFLWTMDDY